MQLGDMFKAKQAWDTFRRNHPQFPAFLQDVGAKGVTEGTDVLIAVTFPDGEKKRAGIHVKADDLALLELLRQLGA